MIIRNEDISEARMEVPSGHQHLRTTIVLSSGEEIVLQEATVANLVRAYVTLKTHPRTSGIVLRPVRLDDRKEGFAEWQLLESGQKEEYPHV